MHCTKLIEDTLFDTLQPVDFIKKKKKNIGEVGGYILRGNIVVFQKFPALQGTMNSKTAGGSYRSLTEFKLDTQHRFPLHHFQSNAN